MIARENTYTRIILLFSIFIFSCILAFWNIPGLSFLIGWDDQWFVLNHYTTDGLNLNNFFSIISDFYFGQYAPVNQLYYTAVYHFFGNNPFVFHSIQLLIHLTNSLLVFYLLQQVLFDNTAWTVSKTNNVAFFTMFLFAVSPFNLESVVWIAATKVVLYGLFYLLALFTYIKYLKTNSSKSYFSTIALFILSFGSKEQAVTLPFTLLMLDYVYDRGLKSGNIWLEKIPFFILSLLFGLVTIQSQTNFGIENSQFYSLPQRISLILFTFNEYLIKTVTPLNLSYLYPFPFQIGETQRHFYLSIRSGASFA